MPLVLFCLVLVLAAIGLGLMYKYAGKLSIDPVFLHVITFIVVLGLLCWGLQVTGVWTLVKSVPVPHV